MPPNLTFIMKTPRFFSVLTILALSFAVIVPQSSEAGARRKTLPNCTQCKKTVYSYYKVTGYKKSRPVYGWEIVGHTKCKVPAVSAAPAAPLAQLAYATHQVPLARRSHVSGSVRGGYGARNYGSYRPDYGYGLSNCGSGYGYGGYGYGGNYGYGGYGYGNGTVTRTTRVTTQSPARGIFGGFSETRTSYYRTRTRVSHRGGYGGRGAYGFRAGLSCY